MLTHVQLPFYALVCLPHSCKYARNSQNRSWFSPNENKLGSKADCSGHTSNLEQPIASQPPEFWSSPALISRSISRLPSTYSKCAINQSLFFYADKVYSAWLLSTSGNWLLIQVQRYLGIFFILIGIEKSESFSNRKDKKLLCILKCLFAFNSLTSCLSINLHLEYFLKYQQHRDY